MDPGERRVPTAHRVGRRRGRVGRRGATAAAAAAAARARAKPAPRASRGPRESNARAPAPLSLFVSRAARGHVPRPGAAAPARRRERDVRPGDRHRVPPAAAARAGDGEREDLPARVRRHAQGRLPADQALAQRRGEHAHPQDLVRRARDLVGAQARGGREPRARRRARRRGGRRERRLLAQRDPHRAPRDPGRVGAQGARRALLHARRQLARGRLRGHRRGDARAHRRRCAPPARRAAAALPPPAAPRRHTYARSLLARLAQGFRSCCDICSSSRRSRSRRRTG